jgi:dTMP kinase
VRAEFLRLAEGDQDHYLVLDARAPVDQVANAVHTHVMKLIAVGAPR